MSKPRMAVGRDEDGVYGVIAVTKAIRCFCGRAVMLMINRGGKTRCVACDIDYRKSKAQQP